ncbi:hypothetical protein [Microcoleus sp. Pol17_C1]|uniref:hypothetical protein n=1 Tax=unclassified Microcoleus TaxID=2642155 RepID=UPI002FD5E50B
MISAQLSLFDTAAAEVGSLYKAGDWVMLRRKPAIAAWVKRGEVYKVNRVHPIDGSLQFWNPHTSDWDFLYPDEVKLAPAPPAVEDAPPPPAVDSPTPAEVAVGESILPPCESDTLIDFDAVGESILPPPAVDSPTPAEVAVGESSGPVGDECIESDAAVSTYKARGTARAGEAKYYRLSYKDGGKVRQVHIRGGNTDSPIAQSRAAEVRSQLAAGIPPAEIAAMLRNSGGKAPQPSCD